MKSQEIRKVITIHPVEDIKVHTKFHNNTIVGMAHLERQLSTLW